jgi:hypothetical protein
VSPSPSTGWWVGGGRGLDAHGNPVTGPSDAVSRYDAAIDHLVRFHVDVVDQMSTLADDHPTFAMGQALAAYLHLMSSDPNDLEPAKVFVTGTTENAANPRELAHAAAVTAWAAGDWHGAARLLDDLLVEWPAAALISRLATYVEAEGWASNHHMTAEVGLPAARAMMAFGEGRYEETVDTLWPARRTFHHFGGSHAQRDALERTLIEAALRSDRYHLADRLLSERLAVRPSGEFALGRLHRLVDATGSTG